MDFLAIEVFESGEHEKMENVLIQLNQRKLGNLFELQLAKSYEELQKLDLRNEYCDKKMYELISKEKFFIFKGKEPTHWRSMILKWNTLQNIHCHYFFLSISKEQWNRDFSSLKSLNFLYLMRSFHILKKIIF